MKNWIPAVIAFLLLSVTFFTKAQDAGGLLEKSRAQVKAQHSIAYKYRAYWPNPVGEIDTLTGESLFVVGKQKAFGYDFVLKANGRDMVYTDGAFREVLHEEKKIEMHPDEEHAVKRFTAGMIPVKYSPVMLLLGKAWQYARDTAIARPLAGYRAVELDTVINGNRVYVEMWLYINKASKLPEWYVQQAYFNGKRTQRIEFEYIDYTLSRKVVPLTYPLPAGYRSEVSGANPGPQVLQAGIEAPVFQVTDLDGKPVDLKALRGKKVLLNFSTINCGYCKMAIDHINRKGFALPDNVVGVYINPIDKPDRVASYAQKSHIPFPVVADARAIGTLYGVSGYPTFFLIDEQGVIQKTVIGYQEAFLNELSKKK
jgi:peroxiredoxin